jgi:hypothetical protein
MWRTRLASTEQSTSYTVDCNIGFTAQSLSYSQYRLCWSGGKCNHNLRLAPEDLHESAKMKPILQRNVCEVLLIDPPSGVDAMQGAPE